MNHEPKFYLKCNNCGHLNEVKTEYLTLCEKCSKKISNNYREWQTDHPEKSFEDYQKEVCLSSDQITPSNQKKKRKKPKGNFFLGFIIGFFTASFLFYMSTLLLGSHIDKFMELKEKMEQKVQEEITSRVFKEETDESILDKEWDRKEYGDLGLSIKAPYTLETTNIEFPPEIRSLIEKVQPYSIDSEKGLKIFVNSIQYKKGMVQLNLENGAYGSVMEMKKQGGVSDFTYSQDNTRLGDIPGIRQDGKFKKLGLNLNFTNIMFSQGLTLWQITLLYQKDDETGHKAVERIINSIQIHP